MFPELEIKEGWVTVICLLAILLCVAWSIQVADWVEGLAILQGVVLVGGGLGITLAKSRAPNRLAHLLSLLAGWTWAAYLTSQVLARSFELSTPLAVIELQWRFYELLLIPFGGEPVADNYVFLLLLSFVMWVMAYFCAWTIFRWQRVWWAVIVCGVALLLNMHDAQANLTIYLLLFLLFSLLLVVRASVAVYEQRWRQDQVGYSSELVATFLRAGLIFSIVVIFLAWIAPEALASRPLQPIWDKVGQPWRNFQERSARIFRDLNYQNPAPLVSLGDRRMWFGGPVELEDVPVADVEAAGGRYWRVVVFHEYISNGWISNDPDIILIGENERDLAFPEYALRSEITQTVTLHRDWQTTDSLIAAAQPLRAGLPLRAAVSFVRQEEDLARNPDRSSLPQAPGDPSTLYAREMLGEGASYQVLSSLTKVDEESLREDGANYPDWVVPRYLQLPDSVPERVKLLAGQITDGSDNAYDKTKAIERYLRKIPYNTQIDAPGLRQDGVDYFLFEAREGYCDYYASSMVVLLRAVGIPARYVRGYSQGESEEGVYHLLESDGHAWPEVYFPSYGWIEFEPTGGEPALNRPRSQESGAGEERDTSPERSTFPFDDPRELLDDEFNAELWDSAPPPEPGSLWQRMGHRRWLAADLLLLGVVLLLLFAVRRRRRVQDLSAAERVYEDLVNWVRRLLRIEPLAHQTPNEYAGTVSEQVPRGRQAVERIAGLYVEERFSGKPVSGAGAEGAWKEVRPALWQRWIGRRLDGLRRFWWRLVPPKEPSQ